ncbi:heme NO-binding domain-containing protein [Rhodobacter sp. Har01]|uniref:heme NO-binding domain-containing protein n=1 Tax=Rhodobacter sp. Har01 TaxID=2883999 RepID=UPI001D08255C|nr:heme NO-binding domain-containing protein [Rhodobacter sp. Har01]MCB6178346.1 heme NO-binding domain-containing protein [Rhodobacter sp. Har01]
MFGLFLRALQGYVSTTFGADPWGQILTRAGFMGQGFEPLLPYDMALFHKVLNATSAVLERPADVVLEDLGTYIVTNSANQAPRRLLRFGGVSYADFLLSVEELPDRARLALPDIQIPPVLLEEVAHGHFTLSCPLAMPCLGHVLIGVLRAMADDYGALVVIEAEPLEGTGVVLSIRLHEADYASGRKFVLAPVEVAHG